MFKFYLNNTECSQGISNWKDLKISIIRDVANRIVRIEMPQEMTFTGECYKIIHDDFNANGYCSLIDVRIEKINSGGGYVNFFTGLIFVNECEFDEIYKTCVVPIRDNSFISRINNNRQIEMSIETDSTKNGESMTALSSISMSMFNPTTGVINGGFAHSGDRYVYDWFGAVNNCVKFMTDNELTAVSDWYTNLDATDKISIGKGIEIRLATHNSEVFFISFDDLTKDIFKAFNLWMTIEGNTVRIEEEDYFFNTTSQISFENVKEVKQTFFQEKFYSNVLFGSASSVDSGTFPIVRFLSFQEENYLLGGKCNIQNTLDLKFQTFITDANIIEDLIISDDNSYDDELFIIQYNSSTNDATDNSLYPLTGHYYNVILSNIYIADRYELNSSMFSVLNSFEDRFWATATSDGSWNLNEFTEDIVPLNPVYIFNQVLLDEDTAAPNFNSNNRFNPATNIYTANTTGYYSFYVNWSVQFNLQDKTDTNGLMLYQRLVSSGGIDEVFQLKQVGTGIDFLGSTGNYEVEATISDIFLTAGETVILGVAYFGQNTVRTLTSYCFFDIKFLANSYAKCLSTPISGGEYAPANPDIFKASLFTFDQKLTQNQVDLLLETPYKAFTFNQDGITNKKVWANEIIINLLDNTANIEAISDIENSG